MKAIIYDCEIIKGILFNGEEPLEGIKYCEGWRDFESMGISVIGVYDYNEKRYRAFCQDNFDELQELINNSDVCVSFNGVNFDNPLMLTNGITVPDEKNFDLLREVWKAQGNNPDIFDRDTHTNCGLDKCCEVNFGTKKTGHGAMAPVHWQRGEYGKVFDYCLNDIKLTKQLFDVVVSGQSIRNPRDPQQTLNIPQPSQLLN